MQTELDDKEHTSDGHSKNKCEAMDKLERQINKLLDTEEKTNEVGSLPNCALVFDCDGTLLDTMPIYYESWSRTCKELDLEFPMERFYSMAGKTVVDIFQILLDEVTATKETSQCRALMLGVTAKDCENIKREHHRVIEEEEGMYAPSIDIVVDIARKYEGKLRLAVASSGWRDHVLKGLERNNILHLFDHVVTADEEEVANPKPAPDIFLEASRRLNVCPERCIGLEDADLGMVSINRANYLYAADVRKFHAYPRNVERRKVASKTLE